MNQLPLKLDAPDGHTVSGSLFSPAHPRAVMVISHGMAEHAGRYTGFAEWLCHQGIAVVTFDHRGHGPTCPPDQLGHYSDQDGWHKVVEDLHQVICYARNQYPARPLILFGHSMGSFIAQSCVQRHGESVDTLILSATNRIHRPELLASSFLIGLIRLFRGQCHRSATITRMTFGKFNKHFRPNRTECDWLSRAPEQVDKYLADPLCGFECTTGLWHDFVEGMLSINPALWRKDLPVHLFAGTEDPVGEMGEGIRSHFQAIREAGIETVTLRLFEGGRHEMLNETNSEDVWQYILQCMPASIRYSEASVSA